MKIINRTLLNTALDRLRHDRVLVVTGARQTGKTTLCEVIIPEVTNLPFTYISFDDPDERVRFQRSAVSILESINTELVILDEVQKIPALFDPLKYVVDRQKRSNVRAKTFILTGSSQLLLMKNIRETLAGRVALMNLYPFSLTEVAGSGAAPLLTRIWENKGIDDKVVGEFNAISASMLRSVTQKRDEHLAWGGYPPVWQIEEVRARLNWLKDYRKTYLERDILDIGQIADIDAFVLVQKLLCARTAQIINISEVARDASLSVNTVKRYIGILNASFQTFLVPPYYENVGKRLIKSPKIYFPDPGLNRVILGDMTISAGAVYESWVFSELQKWKELQSSEPELFFYRTSGGMEIDFLLTGKDSILPIEVKSSAKLGQSDARNMSSFLEQHKSKSPIGIIVYKGNELTKIRENIWAIPDWFLFCGTS